MKSLNIVAQELQPGQPLSGSNNHYHSRLIYCNSSKFKSGAQSVSRGKYCQPCLWKSSQADAEAPYLQIASVPVNERVSPKEPRYILVILPSGVRACGGQFTSQESYAIAESTKSWTWNLDADGRLRCLPQLEALLDAIVKRSAAKGGDA